MLAASSVTDLYCSRAENGTRWPYVWGVTSMTMPAALKASKLLDRDWSYLLDILWDATSVLTIAFVVVMIFIFTIGYAIDFGIVTVLH